MHCYTQTAKAIRAKGADYVLTVKGNQPTLRDQIQQLFIADGGSMTCCRPQGPA